MTMTNATVTMRRSGFPAGRIADAFVAFLRAWKHRREVYRLGEMSDSELADIGLTRSDLNVVVGLPLGNDPTTHLGVLAEARRREIAPRD